MNTKMDAAVHFLLFACFIKYAPTAAGLQFGDLSNNIQEVHDCLNTCEASGRLTVSIAILNQMQNRNLTDGSYALVAGQLGQGHDGDLPPGMGTVIYFENKWAGFLIKVTRGTIGVLSYNVQGTGEKIVVHFENPSIRIFSVQKFVVRLENQGVRTDSHLANRYYHIDGRVDVGKNKQSRAESDEIQVTAAMPECINNHCKMEVSVTDSAHQHMGSASQHKGSGKWFLMLSCVFAFSLKFRFT